MPTTIARAAPLCALLLLPSAAAADPPTADASAATRRAERAAERLLALLDRSRRDRDGARIRCVDRKLSEVDSFARALRAWSARLREARRPRGRDERARERRVVASLLAQLLRAEREGRACVEPPPRRGGRTVVTVTVDPSIRHLDLSVPPAARPGWGRLRAPPAHATLRAP